MPLRVIQRDISAINTKSKIHWGIDVSLFQAAEKGHMEVAKQLLSSTSGQECLLLLRDKRGNLPADLIPEKAVELQDLRQLLKT